METKEIKAEGKSSELISILSQNFAGKMNLARIKFLGKFICALCKVQSVCYEKLKSGFESEAQSASILRRIQRYMAEYLYCVRSTRYVLDTDLIAQMIFKMLPHLRGASPHRDNIHISSDKARDAFLREAYDS